MCSATWGCQIRVDRFGLLVPFVVVGPASRVGGQWSSMVKPVLEAMQREAGAVGDKRLARLRVVPSRNW